MKKMLLSRRSCFYALTLGIALTSTLAARAADVRAFGVVKRANFLQTSATAPTPDPARPFEIVLFLETDDVTAINLAMVTPPSGMPVSLSDVNNYVFTAARSSQAELASSYGPGAYTFAFDTANDNANVAILNVPGDAFSPPPLIANFAALQSVDITKDFNLSWQTFTGGTAADSIQVRVLDETDSPVFETGVTGPALDGTATSVMIPAGILQPGVTYSGFVSFNKAAGGDTTSYPGAAGSVSFASQTEFSLKATIPGGGGGPSLVFISPTDGATDVPVTSPITMVFTTPMQPAQAIVWTGNNVNPANFQYSWIAATTLLVTYSGGLPGNTRISYTLNGFKDSSGVAMAPVSGSFTTGAGNSNPCGPPPDQTKGALALFKTVSYLQTSAAAPVLDPTVDANIVFSASLSSPSANPVVSASVKTPTGQTITLNSAFGRLFSFFKTFSTPAALEAEFPAGAYVATVTRQDGASQTINLTLQGEPPVPHLANWTEANALNSGADFTPRWDPFTAAAKNDSIFLNMHDQAGHDFSAPDPCVPRELANTATSIVIPKNTFAATGEIAGALSFSKAGSQDTSIADLSGFAGFSKMTGFKLRTGSSPNNGLRFNQPVILANGSLQVAVSGTPLASYAVESSTDLKSWTMFNTVKLSAAGSGELTVPRAGSQLFLRAKLAQ